MNLSSFVSISVPSEICSIQKVRKRIWWWDYRDGRGIVAVKCNTAPVKETVFITTAMPSCRNGHESENTLLYALKLEQKLKNWTCIDRVDKNAEGVLVGDTLIKCWSDKLTKHLLIQWLYWSEKKRNDKDISLRVHHIVPLPGGESGGGRWCSKEARR